jgi:hypothetical protein
MQTLNQKGIAPPFLALVVALFILIGVWYVYKSYEQKRLKENLSQVYFDYRTWALTVVKDAKDRESGRVVSGDRWYSCKIPDWQYAFAIS